MKEKNNFLYTLQETQEIVDECDGDSESKLCSNCPSTSYGLKKNYCIHPNGISSCEGNKCKEAQENVEDDLINEYKHRKGELNMNSENKMKEAKMNIQIDLDVLEQNVVKMTTDNIEANATAQLIKSLMSKIESYVVQKIDDGIENKMKEISIENLFNIRTEINGETLNLFEYLIKNMIKYAENKKIEFSENIDKLLESIEYNKVDEDFTEDDFKVLTQYTIDEYDQVSNVNILINGNNVFNIGEGEPEDMTLNRNLNDALDVPFLIKKAYLAGKSGKIMYEAEENVENN
jgi:hypothetical protein